jgi:hypothetical protein
MRIISLLFLALLASCSLFDKEEEIPVYIRINPALVQMGPDDLQTTTIGIKDVWAYQGTSIQGIYPQPSVFPFFLSKGDDLRIYGGVFETGQSGFHLPYPFWAPLDITVAAEPGDTFVIDPVFEYNASGDTVVMSEDFENIAIQFTGFAIFDDTAQIHKSTFDPFQGGQCGAVTFDSDSRFFQIISSDDFSLSPNIDIYAEVTYKTDVELTVGLQYVTPQGNVGTLPAIVLNPNNEWNTLYMHLVEMIRGQPAGTSFKLWMKADGEGENAELFIDNVRVIHFIQ